MFKQIYVYLFKQIYKSKYFEYFLSKYQFGFRKGCSAQHCLLSMLEKWKSAIDNRKMFGVLLTDLSKVSQKVNRLYERCLHLIYNDKKSSFQQLLEGDSSVSAHDRNRRALANEMYKIYHGISPTIMNEIFTLRHQNQYNLRNWTYFDAPKVRTVNHGSESVRYLGSKIWEIIPAYTKELDTTDKFKIAIKKWKPESCPCRLCRAVYKIQATCRLGHKFVALFAHIL